jgi:hypothetical protein
MHNVLKCQNVAKHFKFDARTVSAQYCFRQRSRAVEIKMATFTGAERARCVFWFEETSSKEVSHSVSQGTSQ